MDLFCRLLRIQTWLIERAFGSDLDSACFCHHCPGENRAKFIGDFKFMYVVKADNPPVGFTLSYSVTDSEGNVLPNEETVAEVVSDNASVVDVDQASGVVSFGSPGLANINATIKDADTGALLGSFGAQFTVTVGDPAAIAGGTIAFEGLTEAETETPVEG